MSIRDKIERKHCTHICNGGKYPRYLIIGIDRYIQLEDMMRENSFILHPLTAKQEYSEYNGMEILISYRDKNIIEIK